MGAIGKRILAAAIGLLFAGIPYGGDDRVRGSGDRPPAGGVRELRMRAQEGMRLRGSPREARRKHGKDGGHGHGAHMGERHGMKGAMTDHAKGIRETIGKLRALEAKMETLKGTDDAAAFRAASLEHGKLLTDLQESHLKRMEEMTGMKGADGVKGK